MNRKSSIFFSLIIFLFFSCDVKVPEGNWKRFEGAKPLSGNEIKSIEGIYSVQEGSSEFGPFAVAKWSYTLNGSDTVHHLSFFLKDEAPYFICEARKIDNEILIRGYWRKMVNVETGLVRLWLAKDSAIIRGKFGANSEEPDEDLQLRYLRPLPPDTGYQIIAHRGGGRNNDLLPASENSVEMIKLASRMGATGIEIDVKLSKDSIPLLYHDSRINDRLTTKNGVRAEFHTYSFAELQNMELKRGGRIPTLDEALDTIVNRTPLNLVWLDCKYDGSLKDVLKLRDKWIRIAKARGRKIQILLGIPDEASLERFMKLPDYKDLPSLIELDTAVARQVSAMAWAPSWLKGKQLEETLAMQKEGRRVFVWTVDLHYKLKEFLREGRFNGIVTNRPGMVAYYYYSGDIQE